MGTLQDCTTRRLKCAREDCMNFHLAIGPVVSLVAGILILVVPRLLSYIVAIYLIIIGLVALSATTGYV
jgi:hypothetical protein